MHLKLEPFLTLGGSTHLEPTKSTVHGHNVQCRGIRAVLVDPSEKAPSSVHHIQKLIPFSPTDTSEIINDKQIAEPKQFHYQNHPEFTCKFSATAY
jgi:hypothetical protein